MPNIASIVNNILADTTLDTANVPTSAFPAQTGNAGRYLTTDGSALSWGVVSSANIYNSDGTLTGNRTLTANGYSLIFEDNANQGILFHRQTRGSNADSYAISGKSIAIDASGNSSRYGISFSANGNFTQLNGFVSLTLNSQGIPRLTVTQAGRILIGTTTESTYLLDVQGTLRATGLATLSGGINTNNSSILLYDGGASNLRYGLGISISTLNVFAQTNLLFGISLDQSNMTTSNANLWLYSGMTRVNTQFDAASYKYIYATESISSAITASFGAGRFHNSYNSAGTTYTQYPILSITRAGESGVGFDMSASFGIRRRIAGGTAPKTVLDLNIGETATNGYPDTTIMSITGIGVSINNTTIEASAILSATSTTKGFLPPRMTSTQRGAISSPAIGLLVYQTDATEGLYQYTATGWVAVGSGALVKQTHTSGSTVTVNDTTTWLVVNPASTIASLTVTMPASPKDGQDLVISCGGTMTSGEVITSLTLSPTPLQSTIPSMIQAGETIAYRYNLTNTTWYRIN